MTSTVHILPSGHQFPVEQGQTLLEAGLRAGLALDYGCSAGNCGQCRARLIQGDVERVRHCDFTFGEAERIAGAILTCSMTPVGDVVIEAGEARSASDISKQFIPTKLYHMEQLEGGVISLHLRTPRSQRLRFLAGQRVTIDAECLPRTELSLASCPCDDRNLHFHVPADSELAHALAHLRRLEVIHVEGPEGAFVLNESEVRPLLLIAAGTGFAPVRSLVEHALAREWSAPIRLLRITTGETGHYLDNLCRSWSDALDDFEYLKFTQDEDLDSLVSAAIAGLDRQATTTMIAAPEAISVALHTALEGHGLTVLGEIHGGAV